MGVIIGTAGHVDHGKTELIKALTHIDTDRLKEEKERGLSIELGFAWLDLPKSGKVGIIDVPGHIRFLKNMLAGVGGVDVTLLVVAADEGIMPQTREHFNIMRLLGVKKMIVAITKVDLVDEETLELTQEDIKEFLQGTPFENASAVVTSTKTHQGLDALAKKLDEICGSLPSKPLSEISRLFVDRVFEITGFGTVVTGTLVSGRISQGERLFIYPEGIKTKARQIQVHYQKRKEAQAGERVALNLTGIKKGKIRRGCVISKEGYLKATKRITVCFDILPSVKVLKDWTRGRFYMGSAEFLGRVSLLGAKEKRGGERAFAQLLLEEPGTFLVGDRFVLRNYSPFWLIGGGKILDISSQKLRKSDKSVLSKLEAIDKGGAETAVLIKLKESPQKEELLLSSIGLSLGGLREIIHKLERENKIVIQGRYMMERKTFFALQESILSAINDFYKKYPLRSYIRREELRKRCPLVKEVLDEVIPWVAEIKCEGEKVFLKGYKPVFKGEELAKRAAIEQEFLKSGFKPPKPEVDEVFRSLLEDGTIVKIGEDVFLHKEVLERGKEKIRGLLRKKGEATISEIRNVLSTSRKYAVPLMQYLDSTGFTRRVGDKRVL